MRHIHLLQTKSTNSYLKELLARDINLEDFTLVTTHDQTEGRGQKGNHWESNPGDNITLSLLIRPHLGAATTFDLSIVAALAVQAVVHHALEDKVNVQVKWPNDILIEERKIAGILIENEFSGSDIDCCIIGVGLNVAQEYFHTYRPEATSLALERGRIGLPPIPKGISAWQGELLEIFVSEVRRRIDQMSDHLIGLRDDYHSHLYRMNQKGGRYRTADGTSFEGTLLGVEPSGMLRIQDEASNEVYRFAFKEVQFIFPE